MGKRKEIGCIIGEAEAPLKVKTKSILNKINEYNKIEENELKLWEWMSQYYHYSLGMLISDTIPNIKIGKVKLKKIQALKKNITPSLTTAQFHITEKIMQSMNGFNRHLIHGVTGSGKSRIYLEVLDHVLKEGKNVLYLLPEINLTPQFLDYFKNSLDCDIILFHSEISQSQKYLIWKNCFESQKPTLYIGVRSAVFLPIQQLGLIIIDEEHDTSFKQEDRCAYHARDVAFKKANLYQCPLILGSATPSLEMYYYFKTNQNDSILYHSLKERVGEGYLPEIILMDNREKTTEKNPLWPLNPEMIKSSKESLERGEQLIFYVNRLGYANYLQCRSCGHQYHCPNCAVTLRFFKNKNLLSCLHCSYQEKAPSECIKCHSLTFTNKGFGTEKIQEQLKDQLPVRIERFDRDEIKNLKQLETMLTAFHDNEIQILVGTQMIAKGHNFEKVKKVFILGIDQQLNFPDFRSSERVYQALTQVSGRAGRFARGGQVYVQTYDPESILFSWIKNHSFDGFYNHELEIRKLCECPPFYRMIALFFTHKDQTKLMSHLEKEVASLLRRIKTEVDQDIRVLGPRPANIEKKANQYSWTCLIKSKNINKLHQFIDSFILNYQALSGISLKVDVDPQHLG